MKLKKLIAIIIGAMILISVLTPPTFGGESENDSLSSTTTVTDLSDLESTSNEDDLNANNTEKTDGQEGKNEKEIQDTNDNKEDDIKVEKEEKGDSKVDSDKKSLSKANKSKAVAENKKETRSEFTPKFTLNWGNIPNSTFNEAKDHADITPDKNLTHSATLNLEFSLGDIEEAQPGEIEIKLPLYIFYDRDGNPKGGVSMPIDHAPTEGGVTGFHYRTEDGNIVITNYRTISDNYTFSTGVEYRYQPYYLRDGYTKAFNASVKVNSNENIYEKNSNDLSLKVNTSAQLLKLTNKQYKKYESWPSSIPNKPADADDYIYVVWEIVNNRNYATQPYEITFHVTLSDGGSVIGHLTNGSVMNNPYTPCNTDEFNRDCKVPINNPAGFSTGNFKTGQKSTTLLYTRYPKSAIPDSESGEKKIFENQITVTLTGVDGVTNSLNKKATYEYKSPNDSYPGDEGIGALSFRPSDVHGGINKLEEGSKFTSFVELRGGGRVHSITNGGSGSARVEVNITDQHLFGFTTLTPGEDYSFTGFKIKSIEEYDYKISEEDVWSAVTNTDYASHKAVQIYYQSKGSSEWKYGGSINRIDASNYEYKNQDNEVVTLGDSGYVKLPEEASSVKAVHDTNYYHYAIKVDFEINIYSTAKILKEIANKESARFNLEGITKIFNNNNNPDTHAKARIFTSNMYLYRIASKGYISKSCYSKDSDAHNGQERMAYEVIQYSSANYQNSVYTIDELKAMGVVPEQKKGILYDLLPLGTSIDSSTISVKTYHTNLITGVNCAYTLDTVPNWRGSGRTMLIIYVTAPDGKNYYEDNDNIYSGFRLKYTLNYPWGDIGDYGNEVQNQVAYYSPNGNLPNGYADTGEYFSSASKELFKDLDGDGNSDSTKTNVMYAQSTDTVNPLIAAEAGFSKTVSAGGENNFTKNTTVAALGTYSYKLRYETASDVNAKNIVMYDVLEEGYENNEHWKGEFVSIDTAQPESKGISPKVYYSTKVGLELKTNEADRDLSDSNIWSTTKPSNNADITAVAVDLTKNTSGEVYQLGASKSVVCNIIMRAPNNYADHENAHAYNIGTLDNIIIAGDGKEYKNTENTYLTKVKLKASEVKISQKTDPESGTKDAPAQVELGEKLNYYIEVSNDSSSEAMSNIKIKNTVSDMLKIDAENIKYYMNDEKNNAKLVSESDEVSVTVHRQKLEFTTKYLPAGANITFVVPTTADEDKAMTHDIYEIENTAYLTEFNGHNYSQASETTYHQTKLDVPQEYEKLAINKTSDPESGTEDNPTKVELGDDINYNIKVNNNSENITYINVKIDNIIPDELRIKKDEIKYYYGEDSDSAELVENSDAVKLNVKGQKLEFTIKKFKSNKEISFIVPTTLDEASIAKKDKSKKTILIKNKAYVVEASGTELNMESESTYHSFEIRHNEEDFQETGKDKNDKNNETTSEDKYDNKNTTITDSSKTGDNSSNIFLMLLVSGISAIAGLISYKKKMNKAK